MSHYECVCHANALNTDYIYISCECNLIIISALGSRWIDLFSKVLGVFKQGMKKRKISNTSSSYVKSNMLKIELILMLGGVASLCVSPMPYKILYGPMSFLSLIS